MKWLLALVAVLSVHATGLYDYLGDIVGPQGVMFGATLGTGALTLLDWAKRVDPDGKVPVIVELLEQTNEILFDARWVQGNLPTGHRITQRTGLPTVYWRLMNQGTPTSKSTTVQVDEQTGMLDAWSEVDVKLAALNGNTNEFRLSEAKAFIEAMNQEMASTLIYGNAGLAPEEFNGLAVRYSDLSAANAENIIDANPASDHSDLTSIWLVTWDPNALMGIFPKGSKAGLEHKDYGEQTVETVNGIGGSRLRVLQEQFMWDAGLALKDWRYVVRIANVDIDKLIDGSGVGSLIDLMEHAEELIPNAIGQRVFYVNRTVRRLLRKQIREDVTAGGGLTFENFAGRRTMMFGQTPVRVCDALLNTESLVS